MIRADIRGELIHWRKGDALNAVMPTMHLLQALSTPPELSCLHDCAGWHGTKLRVELSPNRAHIHSILQEQYDPGWAAVTILSCSGLQGLAVVHDFTPLKSLLTGIINKLPKVAGHISTCMWQLILMAMQILCRYSLRNDRTSHSPSGLQAGQYPAHAVISHPVQVMPCP